jgi:hypothetical protein
MGPLAAWGVPLRVLATVVRASAHLGVPRSERKSIRRASAPGEAAAALSVHLDFVERKLDEIDPLADASRLVPHVPDPKPDDLTPFLNGWSPHGPDGGRR